MGWGGDRGRHVRISLGLLLSWRPPHFCGFCTLSQRSQEFRGGGGCARASWVHGTGRGEKGSLLFLPICNTHWDCYVPICFFLFFPSLFSTLRMDCFSNKKTVILSREEVPMTHLRNSSVHFLHPSSPQVEGPMSNTSRSPTVTSAGAA